MNTPSAEIPRELAFRDERGGFSLTLKRNCSISPTALACAFAGLEVLGLGIAFVVHARQAAGYERREDCGFDFGERGT